MTVGKIAKKQSEGVRFVKNGETLKKNTELVL